MFLRLLAAVCGNLFLFESDVASGLQELSRDKHLHDDRLGAFSEGKVR